MSTLAAVDSEPSSVTPEPRKRRRWLVHVAWLVVVLLAFWGGAEVGGRVTGSVLGSLSMESLRASSLRGVRVALRLLNEDDVAVHHRFEDISLRENVGSLTGMPRYLACTPNDVAALAEAKAYITAHPLEAERPYENLYSEGLAYCDKPADRLSRWFFLGL